MNNFKVSFLICFLFLFVFSSLLTPVLAWTVSPVRFEVKGLKGKEYTLTFSVLNESQLYKKRFEIQLDDWIINKNNNFLRKAFNKEVDNKYSASSWIKVTPQQFVVNPGETKNVRFTITIPRELPSEGEYSTGIFVGEKNIEKPLKGEKIVHIKQDTFIGVIVYVRIGKENSETTLKNLNAEAKPHSKDLTKVTLLPAFENHGNVHSRGQILVMIEPVLIPGTQNPTQIPKEFNAGELVVLRESEVTYPVDIPVPLPTNTEWKFTVSTDFGGDIPVLVGTKKYRVPFIEQKKESKQVEEKVRGSVKQETPVKN